MNKNELIASVAEKAGLTKKDSEKAVSAVIESIVETIASGDKVQLVGFGTFEVRERAERTGRHSGGCKTVSSLLCDRSQQHGFLCPGWWPICYFR